MGKYNSSLTRVVPVFDALLKKDPGGRQWLLPLLKLGSSSKGKLKGLSDHLADNHVCWWGDKERRLLPPSSLLKWLVQNVTAPANDSLWGSPATREKRELLVAKDPDTIAEALILLEGPYKSAWYVLEGRSQPDVFLEAKDFILAVEGKRTERTATTTTTWMPSRSQMLRHMDAAWEISCGKKVFGLMIVEGAEPDAMIPSEHWLRESSKVVMAQTLEKSLPHRNPYEREQIAQGRHN